jgi:hypothetical protein
MTIQEAINKAIERGVSQRAGCGSLILYRASTPERTRSSMLEALQTRGGVSEWVAGYVISDQHGEATLHASHPSSMGIDET